MKKFLFGLMALAAVFFAGCNLDDEDDLYYTYSYWGETVYAEDVEYLYADILKSGLTYAGEIQVSGSGSGVYFYTNNGENNFASRLDLIEETMTYKKSSKSYYSDVKENVSKWDDVEDHFDTYYGIESSVSDKLKTRCKDAKGKQIIAFKKVTAEPTKYFMIVLQLNERS